MRVKQNDGMVVCMVLLFSPGFPSPGRLPGLSCGFLLCSIFWTEQTLLLSINMNVSQISIPAKQINLNLSSSNNSDVLFPLIYRLQGTSFIGFAWAGGSANGWLDDWKAPDGLFHAPESLVLAVTWVLWFSSCVLFSSRRLDLLPNMVVSR
jgi:hypothetical protein